MNNDQTASLRSHLHFAAALWKTDPRSDAELLQAFVRDKEEQAFAALVGRHGEMVWNVCLRVLRNATDAEDAFQAAFLRLARDARRIRQPESLAGWLFHTARCCALDLRRNLLRQRQHQEQWTDATGATPTVEPTTTDLAACLDEEIQHLPLKSRTALVLCCLQGRSYKEAATELGCSVATAHRWVLHARELLRRRLVQRGHTIAPLDEPWPASRSSASVTAPLLATTLERSMAYLTTGTLDASRAAALVATGSASLWPWLLGASLCLTLVGTTVLLLSSAPQEPGQAARRPAAGAEAIAAPFPLAWPAVPLTISGTIRDAQGRPCARQSVQALMRSPFVPGRRGLRDEVVAEGTTDAQGRYHLRIPEPRRTWFTEPLLLVQVMRKGYAPESLPVRVNPQGEAQADLRLTPATPLTGKLTNHEGQPLRGATLEIVRVGEVCAEPIVGPSHPPQPSTLPAWARRIAVADDGSFTVPDLGRVRRLWAIVHVPGSAPRTVRFEGQTPDLGELRLTLAPARQVRLRVHEAGTNRPIPQAAVTVLTRRLRSHAHFTTWEHGVRTVHDTEPAEIDHRCDAQGSAVLLLPQNESAELLITPTADEPWLGVRKVLPASDQAEETLVVELPRGRWLTGSVHETATTESPMPPTAVPHAVVHWVPADATEPEWRSALLTGRDALVTCDEQGRFRLAVVPGEVIVRAYGPSPDFVPVQAASPGSKRALFAHATTSIQIAPAGPVGSLNLLLRRGPSTRGIALMPDGSPVRSAMLLCADRVSPVRGYSVQPLPISEGVYSLPGGRDGEAETLYLLEPHARLGTVVDVRCGQRGPIARLAPCGSVRVRVADAEGHPVTGAAVTPLLLAERDGSYHEQPASWFDPVNHAQPYTTDAEGWVEVPALIPGARYQLRAQHGSARVTSSAFRVPAAGQDRLPELRLPPESSPAPRNTP